MYVTLKLHQAFLIQVFGEEQSLVNGVAVVSDYKFLLWDANPDWLKQVGVTCHSEAWVWISIWNVFHLCSERPGYTTVFRYWRRCPPHCGKTLWNNSLSLGLANPGFGAIFPSKNNGVCTLESRVGAEKISEDVNF